MNYVDNIEDPFVRNHIRTAANLVKLHPDVILAGMLAGFIDIYLEDDDVKKFAVKLNRRVNYRLRHARRRAKASK